jgi:hypothetical protein
MSESERCRRREDGCLRHGYEYWADEDGEHKGAFVGEPLFLHSTDRKSQHITITMGYKDAMLVIVELGRQADILRLYGSVGQELLDNEPVIERINHITRLRDKFKEAVGIP